MRRKKEKGPAAKSKTADRLRFIKHDGCSILYADFSDLSDADDMLALLGRASEVISQHPPHSVLTLANVRNLKFNKSAVGAFKSMAERNAPFVKASAIVGMSAVHKMIYRQLVKHAEQAIPPFDDEVAALDWLADHS